MDDAFNILTNAPSEAWVGLLGVIIGAVISIVGTWLTSKTSIRELRIQLEHDKSSKANALKMEKLEELYVLFDNWVNGMFGHYLKLTLVMRGDIDYNQYLDRVIEDGKEGVVDFSRLRMLVDIHGPSLQPSYEKIMHIRETLNEISKAHKHAYKSGDTNGTKYLKPYADAQLMLEELGEEFKREISACANNC